MCSKSACCPCSSIIGRSYAPSTWPAEMEVRFRARCPLQRNTTSPQSIGAWSPAKRKPICPGTPGKILTRIASQPCGSTKFSAPTANPTVKTRLTSYDRSSEARRQGTEPRVNSPHHLGISVKKKDCIGLRTLALNRPRSNRAFGGEKVWFRDLDSNQNSQLQRLMCYRLHYPGTA